MPYMDFPQECPFSRVLYWVGDTDTWDGTAGSKWSLTSGLEYDLEGNLIPAAGGEPVPTANDIVIFTPYSEGTVTLDSAARCSSVIFFAWAGTLSHPSGVLWQISGSLIMSTGMTYNPGTSGSGGILFNSTCELPRIIDFAGHQTRNTEFNGSGEWWLAGDIETTSGSLEITLTAGTLRTQDYNLDIGGFSITGTSTRALYLGSSVVTLFGLTTLTSWDASDTTNLTFDAGTSTINLVGHAFSGGGLDYYNVTVSARQADRAFSGENTFNNLTISGLNSVDSDFKFYDDMTVNGVLTFTGFSTTRRFIVKSDVYGTPRTITASNVVATDVHFQDIIGDDWDFSSQTDVGDCFGNSGITFPSPVNVYWVGNGGSWATTSKWSVNSGGTGGSGRYPLPQDTAIFDANSISSTGQLVSVNPRHVCNIDASTVTNNPIFTDFNGEIFYGSFINGSAEWSGDFSGGFVEFQGRGSYSISIAGLWNEVGVIFNCLTGDYTFNSDFAEDGIDTSATMTLTTGTVDFNNYDVTFPRFSIGADATLSMGTGTITAYAPSNPWTINASATLNAETSTLSITNTGAVTFNGGGKTYSTVTIRTSASTCTINGSNTFTALTAAAPAVLRFENNSTQTITPTNGFNMIGSAGNIINLNRVSSGVFTISSANNQTIDYCTLTNCTGAGGGTFTATNTTDGGGNTNWSITP